MKKNILWMALFLSFFLQKTVASDAQFFDTGRPKDTGDMVVTASQHRVALLARQQQERKTSCKPISYCCGLACCLGSTYFHFCCIPGTVVIACTALSDED